MLAEREGLAPPVYSSQPLSPSNRIDYNKQVRQAYKIEDVRDLPIDVVLRNPNTLIENPTIEQFPEGKIGFIETIKETEVLGKTAICRVVV